MTNFLDDQNASYDKLAKSFLSRKSILAQILKYAVEEFANCSLADIEKTIRADDLLQQIKTESTLFQTVMDDFELEENSYLEKHPELF